VRTEHQQLDARVCKQLAQALGEVAPAETVDEQVRGHAARCCARERFRDQVPV
jgi:hypothetical protein